MFKKKKKNEELSSEEQLPEATDSGQTSTPAKPMPTLPLSDSMAAGVIAIVFAAIGMMMCVKVCKEANPKEKKPKKPKKEKKASKEKN